MEFIPHKTAVAGSSANGKMDVEMKLDELIIAIRAFVIQRMDHYFGQTDKEPDVEDFVVPEIRGWYENVKPILGDEELSPAEQLVLGLALVPHLSPDFYTAIVHHYIPEGGDLPIFGGTKCKNHRGILPTGETIQFVLGGRDLQKRIESGMLIRHSQLMDQGLLRLEPVPQGEPELSGAVSVGSEYVRLLTEGAMPVPDFGPKFPAQKVDTERSWEELVLPDDVLQQIQELKMWISHNDQLMNEWEMHKKLKPGYRVLFHGPSGTGKTLTATLLGKYTGREVFRVDLSTIVSKYIGETEKNLEMLFQKAGNRNWILFFDEADALFGKRTEVQDAHDRYANQEVSYLLQRVERFDGLVILSTNYKSNIDEAFLRRFNAIIKFPFPDARLRCKIWETSLPAKAGLEDEVDLKEIGARYKLAGGSIINAVQYASLRTLEDNSKKISAESLLQGIRREVEKEGKVFDDLRQLVTHQNGR